MIERNYTIRLPLTPEADRFLDLATTDTPQACAEVVRALLACNDPPPRIIIDVVPK